MNTNNKKLLEQAAKEYIDENGDSIEIFDLYVPFDCIPEDEDEPEEWASMYAAELDSSVGFTIVPVSSGTAVNGFALVTV